MNRFFILFLTMILSQSGLFAQNDTRPNILFVLTDDQAPWAFSFTGDPNASTPNMDRLASEGAYLRNAFITTPVCSPSRASFMTSRYASEYGIVDFIPNPGHRLFEPDYNPGLDPASVTFAEVLQDAGYATGLVGKWHLGDWTLTKERKYHPTNHGFDYFMGLPGGGTTPDNPELELNGKIKKFEGLTTDILTDYAIQFIKNNAAHPFLLCLCTRAPHGSWLPVAESDWEPFDKMDPVIPNPGYPDLDIPRVKKEMREYLASTKGVDRNLGRILIVLDELGLSDNTIIIFFSDHGYNMGHNGIKHKGNGIWMTKTPHPDTENINGKYRPNMYDNSIKVPAFVYWPGKIKAGTVIDQTITSLDLYPTIVEMAEADLPADYIVRGRSFLPLLTQNSVPEDWENDYYGEYSMVNYCKAFMRCYRSSGWKLVLDFMNPERNELYHIALDPEENINLINSEDEEAREIISIFSKKILEHMKLIQDPLLDQVTVNKFYYKTKL